MSALKISNGVDPEWKKGHERWVHFNLAMGKKGHKKLFMLEKNLLNSVKFHIFQTSKFCIVFNFNGHAEPNWKILVCRTKKLNKYLLKLISLLSQYSKFQFD